MDNNNSYIEFTFASPAMFDKVSKLFGYIKEKKGSEGDQIQNFENDLNLMDFFDDKELNYFWWPTKQEAKEYWDNYNKLSQEEKRVHKSPGWDYASAFNAVGHGDYIIIGCEQTNENTGFLYYYPHGFPYGGAESLVEALKAFGVEIVKVSDWED